MTKIEINDFNWKADQSNKEKVSLEETKFIYDQSEKYLKEVNSSGDTVVSRSTTLIALLVGLISAMIGYYIKEQDVISYISLIGAIYLFLVLIYLSQNIMGRKYSITGIEPRELFMDAFFVFEDEKFRNKVFIWGVIEAYQNNIDKNNIRNNKRWKIFNYTIIVMIVFPVFMIISYHVIKVLT